ncbi:unnamed protein product, partial [Pelagomonas calceolata]
QRRVLLLCSGDLAERWVGLKEEGEAAGEAGEGQRHRRRGRRRAVARRRLGARWGGLLVVAREAAAVVVARVVDVTDALQLDVGAGRDVPARCPRAALEEVSRRVLPFVDAVPGEDGEVDVVAREAAAVGVRPNVELVRRCGAGAHRERHDRLFPDIDFVPVSDGAVSCLVRLHVGLGAVGDGVQRCHVERRAFVDLRDVEVHGLGQRLYRHCVLRRVRQLHHPVPFVLRRGRRRDREEKEAAERHNACGTAALARVADVLAGGRQPRLRVAVATGAKALRGAATTRRRSHAIMPPRRRPLPYSRTSRASG